MKLNLGCGTKLLEGFVNVDIIPVVGAEVIHDLNDRPWPWLDSSVTEIIAKDLVEHLDITLVGFMDECWRILAPGGTVYVKTPDAKDIDLSFTDPTHRWHLRKHSFANYLSPAGVENFHYTERAWCWIALETNGHYITCHAQPIKRMYL